MDGDQLGTIRKSCFDLNVVDHFCYPVHHLIAGKNMPAACHQRRNALAISCTFDDMVRDQRDGLGMVEFYAAFQPPARDHCGHRDHKFIFFASRKIHFSNTILLAV